MGSYGVPAGEWHDVLLPAVAQQPEVETYLGDKRSKTIFPVRSLTFRALEAHDPVDYKVVIFGQSPYPRLESATGIAMFDGKMKEWTGPLSPSLRCIIKGAAMWRYPEEIQKETKIAGLRALLSKRQVCSPTDWFEHTLLEGVLWLNTSLTTGGDLANGKHEKFWKPIINTILTAILEAKSKSKSSNKKGLVFCLWGGPAKKLRKVIEKANARLKVPILFQEGHNPAAQGDIFCDTNAFADTNGLLESLGMQGVDWLPTQTERAAKKRKREEAGEGEEAKRISSFMNETVEMHKMLVERIMGVAEETGDDCEPLTGVMDQPVLPLEDACATSGVTALVPNMATLAAQALAAAKKRPIEGLSVDQVAAVYLYTMGSSFYKTLNKSLRDVSRKHTEPFFPYLRLLLCALEALPSKRRDLWRGVNMDLSRTYTKGQTVVWWGVSSCTTTEKIARGFMGPAGTLFKVSTSNGVNIRELSAFKNEDEVLLPPGTPVTVTAVKKVGSIVTVSLRAAGQPLIA